MTLPRKKIVYSARVAEQANEKEREREVDGLGAGGGGGGGGGGGDSGQSPPLRPLTTTTG